MAVHRCKSMFTLFSSFCDKMLIDPLNYFRKGSLFSNELRFDLEAQMNQLYERICKCSSGCKYRVFFHNWRHPFVFIF